MSADPDPSFGAGADLVPTRYAGSIRDFQSRLPCQHQSRALPALLGARWYRWVERSTQRSLHRVEVARRSIMRRPPHHNRKRADTEDWPRVGMARGRRA